MQINNQDAKEDICNLDMDRKNEKISLEALFSFLFKPDSSYIWSELTMLMVDRLKKEFITNISILKVFICEVN